MRNRKITTYLLMNSCGHLFAVSKTQYLQKQDQAVLQQLFFLHYASICVTSFLMLIGYFMNELEIYLQFVKIACSKELLSWDHINKNVWVISFPIQIGFFSGWIKNSNSLLQIVVQLMVWQVLPPLVQREIPSTEDVTARLYLVPQCSLLIRNSCLASFIFKSYRYMLSLIPISCVLFTLRGFSVESADEFLNCAIQLSSYCFMSQQWNNDLVWKTHSQNPNW